MSLMNLNFESKYLYANTQVTIILPDKTRGMTPAEFYGSGRKYPVMLLLHGTFGDHTDWLRKTSIELYAEERECIVVMPNGINSYYEDWNTFGPGYNVEKYLIEELLPMVHGWLPASDKREDNYVAGLSMGSLAALRFLLDYPEKFGGGIMLSAFPKKEEIIREEAMSADARDIVSILKEVEQDKRPLSPAFSLLRAKNAITNLGSVDAYMEKKDLRKKMLKLAKKEQIPKMFFACGTEDFYYETFCEFKKFMEDNGVEAEFKEAPGGHEWRFWDKWIEAGMDSLKILAKSTFRL